MAQQELPAHLRHIAAKSKHLNEAVVGGITSFVRPPHISIDKNRFTLVNAAGERDTLRQFEIDLIVVSANPITSQLYYGGDYDPTADEHEPPKCFSDNNVAPSMEAREPQNSVCATCDKRKWGSATSKISNKPIPACSQRKKLAVLYDGLLYQFVIPPASLANWQEYAKYISTHPTATMNVIYTRVTFDEKITGVLNFTTPPDPWIIETDSLLVDKITDELCAELTGIKDKPRQALPAPEKSEKERAIEERQSFKDPVEVERAKIVHVEPKPAFVQTRTPEPKDVVPPANTKRKGGFFGGDEGQAADVPAGPARTPPKGSNGGAFGMAETRVSSPDVDAALHKALGALGFKAE